MINRENRRANVVKIILVVIVCVVGGIKFCCYWYFCIYLMDLFGIFWVYLFDNIY